MRSKLGVCLTILLFTIILLSCGKQEESGEAEGLRIAALNETESALVYRSYSAEHQSGRELIDELLDALRKEDEASGSRAVLCAGADVQSFSMEEDQLILTMEEGYRELISRDPGRYIVVDARGGRDEIAKEIADRVLEKLMAEER